MEAELTRRCLEYGGHFSALTHVETQLFDAETSGLCAPSAGRFCAGCTCGRCVPCNTFSYGCSEAFRWGGKYIYYCPLGLVFCAAILQDAAGRMLGGLLAGPVVMGLLEDTLMGLPQREMEEAVRTLPVFSAEEVNHLSEVFAAGVAAQSALANSMLNYRQEQLLNAIYRVKESCYSGPARHSYPIRYEKDLQSLILQKDQAGAEERLQLMLSHIFLSCDFDMRRVRQRACELAVLLSRATIDAGADINEVLALNGAYWEELEGCATTDEVSQVLTRVLHRYLACSFCFATVKHSDIVYHAMEFVKSHYAEKISLAQVAEYVGLNKSYFSSLFKSETGMSMMAYIHSVRVERSKVMLMDASLGLAEVAALCGFEDQSYFTKIFKRVTGVTPKRYRDGRGVALPKTERSPS